MKTYKCGVESEFLLSNKRSLTPKKYMRIEIKGSTLQITFGVSLAFIAMSICRDVGPVMCGRNGGRVQVYSRVDLLHFWLVVEKQGERDVFHSLVACWKFEGGG